LLWTVSTTVSVSSEAVTVYFAGRYVVCLWLRSRYLSRSRTAVSDPVGPRSCPKLEWRNREIRSNTGSDRFVCRYVNATPRCLLGRVVVYVSRTISCCSSVQFACLGCGFAVRLIFRSDCFRFQVKCLSGCWSSVTQHLPTVCESVIGQDASIEPTHGRCFVVSYRCDIASDHVREETHPTLVFRDSNSIPSRCLYLELSSDRLRMSINTRQ